MITRRSDRLPESLHRGRELRDLSHMHQRKRAQRLAAAVSQQNVHDRMASAVTPARDQARTMRTIDKADHTVMAQHERLRELADSRATTTGAAAYRQQQLMLSWGQAMLFCLLLAPAQEATQAGAQLQ